MPLTEGFVEFTAIVEAGSIRGAARDLGMSRATVHRHLEELEARMGLRLLHRTTRSLAPTRAGAELYRHARRIVADAQAATEAVRALDDHPRGLLRISVPPEANAMAPMLLAFAETYPDVQLEVDASSAHVDLRSAQVDVAIRAGRVRDADLMGRTLTRHHSRCVAARSYLEARGTPSTAADLADHDLLLAYDAGRTPQRTWPLLDGGTVRVQGRIASNDLMLLARAAAAGHGIMLGPASLLERVFSDDDPAITVLEDVVGTRSSVSLVWTDSEYLQPKVRAFIDHVVAWFAAHDPLKTALEPMASQAP